MPGRTRPPTPESERPTSTLEEWRRDRADARRLDPVRFKKARKPEPEMSTGEIMLGGRMPTVRRDEGKSRA